MGKNLVLCIDGNNMVMRSHYAMVAKERDGAQLKTSAGVHSGSLFQCVSTFAAAIRILKPTHVLFTFDGSKSLKRIAIRPEYKGNRAGATSFVQAPSKDLEAKLFSDDGTVNFSPLFDAFKEFLAVSGVRFLQEQGVEADDIISAATVLAQGQDTEMIIISSDHDLLQLVTDSIRVLKPAPNRQSEDTLYDTAAVIKKYGMFPVSLPFMWALQGDKGDNIAGIPGVGPKTAVKIMGESGSWASILQHPKVFSHRILVEENLQLIQLDMVTAKFDVTLEQCRFDPKKTEDLILDWLSSWEMESLIGKLKSGSLWDSR